MVINIEKPYINGGCYLFAMWMENSQTLPCTTKKKKSVMLSAHATHTAVSDLLTSTQLENVVTSHSRTCVPIRKCKEACLSFPLRRGEWVVPPPHPLLFNGTSFGFVL